MKRQSGFTILEILVALAIVGILTATAVPLYHTWQGRAYGSEASIMLKQIIGAEINYLLDNNKFYPDNATYMILHDGETDPQDAIQDIEENLHITLSQGHFLEYYLQGSNVAPDEGFFLTIRSKDAQFEIFKDAREIVVKMDKNGNVDHFYPHY